MFFLAFALVITICGTATAATPNTAPPQLTTINQNNINSISSTSQAKITKNEIKADPVDIRVRTYPWVWDSSDSNFQYNYGCRNTPVFTADIKNLGPDDATNVQIKYRIGNGMKYEGYSIANNMEGTVTYNNNILTWNIPYMPTDGIAYMKVFTSIQTTGSGTSDLTNIATLTHTDQTDSNSANNQGTCSINVPPAADIEVTQETPTYNGQTVTMIIDANNNGPNTATNVNINDLLPPAEFTNIIATPTIGTYDSTTGIWDITKNGPFLYDETGKLTLVANIVGSGTIINTAYTDPDSADQYDWNLNNNAQTRIIQNVGYTPTVDIRVRTYPWVFDNDAGGFQYNYGCRNTPVFTTDIRNMGPDDATNVQIQYKIGKGMTYEGYSIANNMEGTITYNNNILTWNIPYMPAGGIAYLKVFTSIIASGSGNQPPLLTNIANLTHVDQTDSNSANNQATTSINVPIAADIEVTQSKTYPSADTVSIIIKTSNNGPNTATNVNINDLIPAGLTVISTPTLGTYDRTTGIWNIPSLIYGQTETLTLVVSSRTFTNTASTDPDSADQYDWNLNNNAQTLVIT
jgi:uncharacterized repeat protein (TIGR01451 family)